MRIFHLYNRGKPLILGLKVLNFAGNKTLEEFLESGNGKFLVEGVVSLI